MSWTRRDVVRGAIGLSGVAVLPGIGRAEAAAPDEIGGAAFGTTWRVLLPARNGSARLRREIAGLLASLDRAMSPFHPDSEISRLNDAREGATLSAPLADVVQEGLRVARLTGGAFDPAVGPVVARFGFGPIRVGNASASSADWRGFALSGRTVIKRDPELTFDPCGIGKGYALDRIGGLLTARGVDAFFAEFGGEVLVRGRHPAHRPWRAGIEDPTPSATARRPRHAIRMTGGAIATSGDRFNAYVVDGRRYSHIVDPRTGAPVDNGVASVSVVARTAMRADALATALMVLGPTRGLALAEREALPVLFVLRDNGAWHDVATASFRAMMIV